MAAFEVTTEAHRSSARRFVEGLSVDELEFIVDRTIKQAVATQAPATLILSPLLTGGKAVKL